MTCTYNALLVTWKHFRAFSSLAVIVNPVVLHLASLRLLESTFGCPEVYVVAFNGYLLAAAR